MNCTPKNIENKGYSDEEFQNRLIIHQELVSDIRQLDDIIDIDGELIINKNINNLPNNINNFIKKTNDFYNAVVIKKLNNKIGINVNNIPIYLTKIENRLNKLLNLNNNFVEITQENIEQLKCK
jgi:predicted oxidoreductase